MIQDSRIRKLNKKSTSNGDYVVYWMQAAQRTRYNHALEYAITEANQLGQPLLVFFGLTDEFPEANTRHYHFMLEGLKQVSNELRSREIPFLIQKTSPDLGAIRLGEKASSMIVDGGYLNIEQEWRKSTASQLDCPLYQVETNLIVPVESASPKEEYAAYTFRKKIKRQLEDYLVPLSHGELEQPFKNMEEYKQIYGESDLQQLNLENIEQIIEKLDIDHSVKPVAKYEGGAKRAYSRLQEFIDHKLDNYPELSNDPTTDNISHLSPYLHFGQISPLEIALKVMDTDSPGKKDFLEQLIVRRELSFNFVHYNPDYSGPLSKILPEWAQKTLQTHRGDAREYIYTRKQLEKARTHDHYWNSAQKEMMKTGKMHNYMRMYWGKKILEWSQTPEAAFETALYLNNKYQLDGRDPNSFAGVAWCFGKHDRAWAEREIFGKVRYMNANGLERKFDAEAYVEQVNNF